MNAVMGSVLRRKQAVASSCAAVQNKFRIIELNKNNSLSQCASHSPKKMEQKCGCLVVYAERETKQQLLKSFPKIPKGE
ncbi:hypothetical protein [uncultured Sulfitobacter sp.]|uniref:hypothetical protein n=1 Tax=uncultured Sulfitobacter sp. TaxID=191468 RepID=UPI002627772C|nr:hypothetical protein [uncultured Sulfitobacter sp.]